FIISFFFYVVFFFFFSSRRRHTRFSRDWSSDVCSSDLFVSKRHLYYLLYYLPMKSWKNNEHKSSPTSLYDSSLSPLGYHNNIDRSEERRVGKECRSRWRREY